MVNLSVGVLRWLKSGLTRPDARRRRRARNHSGGSAVSAETDQLEVRQVLSVTYHGGALLTNVEAQPVYLGSDWQSTTALKTQTSSIDQFVSSLVHSSYMDMLTQAGYNVGRGTASAGVIDNTTLSKTQGITDAQIQADLQSMISSGKLQTPDANRLYIVYAEPGVLIRNGQDASNTTFLGYHGAFAGKTATGQAADIRYAVIPYPGTPNPSSGSQGFSSTFNEMTSVTSHELAEAVTDPDVNYKTAGWYDDRLNGEIGDLTRINTVLNGYVVQDVVGKNDQPISPGSVQSPTPTPNPPPVVTLSAPQNVKATALSSTSAALSWDSTAGAQGYSVYEVIGSQKYLLGSVSSTTTAVTVTGLTAGTTTLFMIEAYNSTATADSQTVSVTTPATAQSPLAAPVVTATVLSSTTAALDWNPVHGALGYRIFLVDSSGNQVLLGIVGGRTTSVYIVGLTPGSTAQFIVEAFNHTAVADSTIVPVTTPAASADMAFSANPKRWWWLN